MESVGFSNPHFSYQIAFCFQALCKSAGGLGGDSHSGRDSFVGWKRGIRSPLILHQVDDKHGLAMGQGKRVKPMIVFQKEIADLREAVQADSRVPSIGERMGIGFLRRKQLLWGHEWIIAEIREADNSSETRRLLVIKGISFVSLKLQCLLFNGHS